LFLICDSFVTTSASDVGDTSQAELLDELENSVSDIDNLLKTVEKNIKIAKDLDELNNKRVLFNTTYNKITDLAKTISAIPKVGTLELSRSERIDIAGQYRTILRLLNQQNFNLLSDEKKRRKYEFVNAIVGLLVKAYVGIDDKALDTYDDKMYEETILSTATGQGWNVFKVPHDYWKIAVRYINECICMILEDLDKNQVLIGKHIATMCALFPVALPNEKAGSERYVVLLNSVHADYRYPVYLLSGTPVEKVGMSLLYALETFSKYKKGDAHPPTLKKATIQLADEGLEVCVQRKIQDKREATFQFYPYHGKKIRLNSAP
jgi:hypothetical protein